MASAAARYLHRQIETDLSRKMVFLAGARQVGKTTLSKSLKGGRLGYLNWDIPEDRQRILRREFPNSPLWILDEIHKYRSWRGLLKGLYDGKKDGQRILVTGSARLDFYRFGGDSLQGRYNLLRLHPLSVAELALKTPGDLSTLLTLGGFPEPYFGSSEVEARRWSKQYISRLVREDVVSLERVSDLGNLELLALRLPDLVGSPLSINALREDLGVSHKTVENWVKILERLYAIFRLPPFGAPKIRAVKKEQKHYHFDWTLVASEPLRFENLVASHLLKWVQYEEDTQGRNLELRFFRDKDGREVDFVVTENRKPILMVEAKWSDGELDKGLRYLSTRFPGVPAYQISATGKRDFVTPEGVRVCPAVKFLGTLV
jgi:uncharacterized protein